MAKEDYLTYEEVDATGKISVSSTMISIAGLLKTELNAWVVKDMGAGHFGDFEHKVEASMSAMTQERGDVGVWALYNAKGPGVMGEAQAQPGLRVCLYNDPTPSPHVIAILDAYYGGVEAEVKTTAADNLQFDKTYYFTIRRQGSIISCEISDGTSLIVTLSMNLATEFPGVTFPSFRYIYAYQNWGGHAASQIFGEIRNLDLQEEIPPPPPGEHTTPWSGTLPPGNYLVTFPPSVLIDDVTYNFKQWEDGSISPQRIITVPQTGVVNITAYYVRSEYVLTVTSTAGGTTNPIPGSYSYTEGTVTSVDAIPQSGYVFDHWELDGVNVGTALSISVTMNADHTLHAVFIEAPPTTYTLTITATAGGTTSPQPGAYSYTEGTVQTITALPDADYKFVHWELNGVIHLDNPINVLMNADATLHAVFEYVPPPPETATIKGKVKDAGTEAPLAGATVTCNGYTDMTESDGSYEFADLPLGAYTLKAEMAGYVAREIPVDASTAGIFNIDILLSKPPPSPIPAILLLSIIYAMTRGG